MRNTKPTIRKFTLVLLSLLIVSAAAVVAYNIYSPRQNDLNNSVESDVNSNDAKNSPPHQPLPTTPMPPPSVVENGKIEIAKLKQEQAKLLKEFDKLQSNLQELQDKSMLSSDVGSDPDNATESPEAEEERINTELIAQLNLLDETLERETVDSEWSSEAAIALQASANQDRETSMEVIDVNCASSLCRMMITFTPGEHDNSFRHIQDILPWSGEMFFQVEDVSVGEAVVYIGRENYPLPRVFD
jgi:hypothetical protein